MLQELFLSMLMILLSNVTVSRHLICAKTRVEFLRETSPKRHRRLGAGSGLLISILEKLNLFCLTVSINLVLNVKSDGSVPEKKINF